uniref:Cilia- and flagella-associated protein 91 n=1 Tax=Takifugu rubripes TaxID=31033 RepID=A0A674NSD6_TAKRU
KNYVILYLISAFLCVFIKRRVAEFRSMFSSPSHHPTCTLQLESVDPVPASVGRRWRGSTKQNMVALQQRTFVHNHKSVKTDGTPTGIIAIDIRVTHFVLYSMFKRCYVNKIRLEFKTALPASNGGGSDDQAPRIKAGVQTDYRESEAQTDPYSPEYVLQPGATPSELLQLETLTWGSGLPVGLREVEMIQHQQAKRALEAKLPPLDDLSQLDKRRKMMEEIEAQDWAFREAEIQKSVVTHMLIFTLDLDLLKQRVMSQEKATNQTLNKLYSKIQNEKEKRQQAIHDDYMRKLEAKRQTAKEKILTLEIKHSVANETWLHTDFSTNESAYNDYIKSHYLQEYSGLTLRFDSFVFYTVTLKTINMIFMHITHVGYTPDMVAQALKKEIEQVEEKPLRFLVKKEKPVPRPATPTVHEPPEGEEEEECAIIFIQKLLRGRKVQCEMLQGIEDRMDLIRELQTVHALQEEEQELQEADRDFVLSLKEQRDKARHQTPEAGAMGAELHHLLDTLSKELIRLQEERRIHALVLLAERDRRLREAEESGRRQVEERRRREEDQIFRQVVQVHQETVDLYLEDIILDTLENTTDQRAREDIHRRAQEVNHLAFAMEER